MKTSSIYVYDNKTGVSLPSQIDVYPVEILLGSTISEVHQSLQPCYLFCVFTHLNQDTDIIVRSTEDAKALQEILDFGKYKYKIKVEENSAWYSDKADNCLIISDSVQISSFELSKIISLYRNEVVKSLKAHNKIAPKKVYSIVNTRNYKIIGKTLQLSEAKEMCKKNPCCIIVDQYGNTIESSNQSKSNITSKDIIAAMEKRKRNFNFKLY